MTTALVSGASVAGLATAYWLEQHGYSVTVVERYDGLRPGGQAIDGRGPALGILDRMGLRQAAENMKTNIRGASFVDRDGNELSRDTEATPTGGVIDNPDIEILRDDLVDLLRGSLSDDVDFIFSDSITGLDDRGDVILAGELASAGRDHQRGFANYDATFRPYVERTQRLVDLDEGMNGGPIAPDDFYNVVHSIELKDY